MTDLTVGHSEGIETKTIHLTQTPIGRSLELAWENIKELKVIISNVNALCVAARNTEGIDSNMDTASKEAISIILKLTTEALNK